jgi:phage terminase large subunit
MEIVLPNQWRPRDYQRRLWNYLEGGGKRAVSVWHRRAGKDDVCLHWTACAAMQRAGIYWHMLPEASQARKAVWDAINPHTGRRRIDEAFPHSIRAGQRDEDMRIKLLNGSLWQVVGSDNFNSLVGAPPTGLVFSEYALTNPAAWDYLRPILAENGGWCIFMTTPRGRNHAWKLYDLARSRADWFAELLTVEDTTAIAPEIVADERASGMSEDMVAQEYYCSFDAALPGAYYGKLLQNAETEGRIGRIPWAPDASVHTAWDLGIGDSTAIWFCQQVAHETRVVDYYENFGVGLDHYAKILREKPYAYGDHILPHDAQVADLSTGRSRLQTLASLGVNGRVLPREPNIEDGINAVRNLLPRCWFDADKCARGLDALRQYRCDYDAERKIYSARPRHDWTSHAADAFRYLARGLPEGAASPAWRHRYAPRWSDEGTWMSA